MTQTGKIVFIVFMIGYALFWGTIILIGIPREQRAQNQKKYDERQIFEQGRACKYAFFSLITYLAVYGILDDQGVVWCRPIFGIALGIILSLCIYLTHRVLQDAYFAIGESKPAVLIAPNAIAISQLIIGIDSIAEGTMIENGLITADGLHFLLVALVLFLDLAVFLRKRLDKRS